MYCCGDPINKSDPTGLDWVENIDTRKIIWINSVTSKENTPEGYRFIGSTNNDILRFYGLKSVSSASANGRSFGLAGQYNKKYGSGAGYFSKIDSNLQVKVEENDTYDSNGHLINKEFIGLTISGVVIQSRNILYNENALFYKGGLRVLYNGQWHYALLKRSDLIGTNLLPDNTISHSSSIFIPAKQLAKDGCFSIRKIEINLGATNPRYLIVTPIIFIYKK